jgi:hypothetical protein
MSQMNVVLDNTDQAETYDFDHVTLKQALEGLGQLVKENSSTQSDVVCISSYSNISNAAESDDQIMAIWQMNFQDDVYLKIGGWGLLRNPKPV